MRIDRAETLRYLGFRGQQLTDADERNLARAEELCAGAAEPRTAAVRFPFDPDSMTVGETGVVFRGEAVKKHLAGPAVGVMTDAAAVSAIESVMDDLSRDIAEREGGGTTRRFSCGYADFPLSQQLDFMRLLDMGRRLGVFIGADMLMTPQKTVTAVIGVRKSEDRR